MEPEFEFRERFDTEPEIVELARQAVATLFGRAPQKKCVMLCPSTVPGTLVIQPKDTYQNKYDYSGNCAKEGFEKEHEFCRLMSQTYGWDVVTTPKETDVNHIDVWASHCIGGIPSVDPLKHYSIDVKGIKKVKRTDSEVQDNLIWVELEANQRPGWLYSSCTDWIAFRCCDDVYLLVELSELVKLVQKQCDLTQVVEDPTLAVKKKYKRVTRTNKIEYLTLLPREEVEEIALAIIAVI